MFNFQGKNYSSKKHPILEHIFRKYYDPEKKQKEITFYLSDISEGYGACEIPEPVSISNTILDLTRQDRGINSRVPMSISNLGYDLRKRTGQDAEGNKFAGEFVLVGIGNSLKSWLVWPKSIKKISIDSSSIPQFVMDLIRPDEGGLFSVIDYTDLFSVILYKKSNMVFRVQNPMKWQPNEIDGFYAAKCNDQLFLYPIEAKALTTKDDINLDQLKGAFDTIVKKMNQLKIRANIQQLALKMIKNGIDIAVFPANKSPIEPMVFYSVKFSPPIKNWK